MKILTNLFVKPCIILAASVFVASCGSEDMYDPNAGGKEKKEEPKAAPNTFNFSTTQKVKLSIDYSADNLPGAVFFSIYSENPFNVTKSADGYETRTLKENVSAVYENYTDNSGRFNTQIELPAYVKNLYVLTGNFAVSEPLMTAEVKDGKASVAVASQTAQSARRAMRRADGASTTSLESLWNISYMDNNWTKGDQIYKEWFTPLGAWNSDNGRPEYVNDAAISENLKFTAEEFQTIYDAATTALNVNRQCSDEMITQADLELIKDSEVGITVVGGNTCWNSTMGYYYYTGEAPTNKMDMNIIMLFPNTQDGHWVYGKTESDYNGNIGMNRGDVVQLMYYPNIASGSLEGATKTFPKGTKLGFILKTNGWGMQQSVNGKNYYIARNFANRKYNNWNTSTDGLSYFVKGNTGDIHYENPTGASRTAKFQCTTADNHSYAIVSFEDAFNDKNYSDVVFALKPMDAFQELPAPEDKVVETKGIYCFEDKWPSKGDYDMNDAVVAFKHTKKFSKNFDQKQFMIVKETFSLTTYQNYVTLKSGLAMTLDTPVAPTEVVMKKVKNGNEQVVSFTKEDNVYLLTDHIKSEVGTEYLLELYYENGISDEQASTGKPFIYRDLGNDKRLEIHIVGEAPTSKMDTSYFGKEDDCSDASKGLYYVRAGNYPFAFYLNNATVSDVAKLLDPENESKSIDQLYGGYLNWVKTNGGSDAKWYKE